MWINFGEEVEVREMSLRECFDAQGFGVVKYAKAHGLGETRLSEVLGEKDWATGTNRSRVGATRKVYAQLKKDGIYIGALPWEMKR